MCDHHHHGGSCAHEHTEEPEKERGAEYSLYQYIDTGGLTCLNERGSGTVAKVFKPWDQRLDRTAVVESDTDEQLIIHIPFTASIKLKAINIIGGADGTSPGKLKAWINREDIDFSSVDDVAPTQEWELSENPQGEIEYPTRITKFQNVTSLTLYIPENFGAERTIISYIGLKGEFKTLSRKAVNVTYESAAQLKDHKVPESEQMARHIGQ
ncbi:thioredoxin family Trp26 family protein [Acanthamoeba castellanii str. Neff]|uniref:Thioredoxin family Trp26 family protein n=1 Tax=Acanthamoeba castellanii (strain ATCC 30010 / Neff) TaxID=1257118 RepID=L8GL73_ACACF|nr:thioredoxin family Trp26 family protein [Acanthamoeba castellanii str. Neff]ELR13777.1 thioredoxin family Trp26 family protein [Acanthamoeba castellanii str. Neff]